MEDSPPKPPGLTVPAGLRITSEVLVAAAWVTAGVVGTILIGIAQIDSSDRSSELHRLLVMGLPLVGVLVWFLRYAAKHGVRTVMMLVAGGVWVVWAVAAGTLLLRG